MKKSARISLSPPPYTPPNYEQSQAFKRRLLNQRDSNKVWLKTQASLFGCEPFWMTCYLDHGIDYHRDETIVLHVRNEGWISVYPELRWTYEFGWRVTFPLLEQMRGTYSQLQFWAVNQWAVQLANSICYHANQQTPNYDQSFAKEAPLITMEYPA